MRCSQPSICHCHKIEINKEIHSMKNLSYIFTILAIILSDIMCAVVAYNYRGMLCGIKHMGYSAPANVAFIYAIPFLVGIIICVILAYIFHKKSKL